MTPEQEKQIEKIKDETERPFDFECLKTKFGRHYKILKNHSWKGFLETSERPPPLSSGQQTVAVEASSRFSAPP